MWGGDKRIEIKRSKGKLVQSWWSSRHVPVTPVHVVPPLHTARSPYKRSTLGCPSTENTPGLRALLLNGSNQATLLTLRLLNTSTLHQITGLHKSLLRASSPKPGSWACPGRSSPLASCGSALSRACDCPGSPARLGSSRAGLFSFCSLCDPSRRPGSRF